MEQAFSPTFTAIEPGGHTAVLLFARSIEQEAQHRSFGFSARKAHRCHRALRSRLMAQLDQAQLPVIQVDEANQRGTCFAERLVHAITQTFARGFDSVIVLGGDSPDVEARDVMQAAAALKAGHSAIGRDQRGGVYLFALQREALCTQALKALPWCTSQLAAALTALLPYAALLRERRDVHTGRDLQHAAIWLRGQRLWSFLYERQEVGGMQPLRLAPRHRKPRALDLRGPPASRLAA